MNLIEAIDDQNLFEPHFRGASWDAWRSFLKSVFALPMTEADLGIYRAATDRETPPTTPCTEVWTIVGRRGGKSYVLALIAVWMACFKNWVPYLSPGEVATVMVIASDRKQARTILRYVNGLLHAVPLLQRLIIRERTEGTDLSNSVSIEVHTASFRAVRGYTIVAALCDETAFWRSDESANPDHEILNALRPAMATVPGAMLLCAGSPYAQRGAMYDAYQRHHGRDGSNVLVWRAPTQTMNPSVPQRIIDQAYADDPDAAAAEYGAEFRKDVADFITREAVEACIIPDCRELPFEAGITYNAFVDPSGGSRDSFTIAISHCQRSVAEGMGGGPVLDAVREVRPPFSPEGVVAEYAALLKSYRISTVTGDRYAGEWPREQFRKHGITYLPSKKTKSDLYVEMLPLINAGRCELLDVPRMTHQIAGLERRTARSGRDSIDHAPGAHDDLANVCAGALVNAAAPIQLRRTIPIRIAAA